MFNKLVIPTGSGGSGSMPIPSNVSNCYFSKGSIANTPLTITVPDDIKYIFILEGYPPTDSMGRAIIWDYNDPNNYIATDPWEANPQSIIVGTVDDTNSVISNINGNTFQYDAHTSVQHWYKMIVLY